MRKVDDGPASSTIQRVEQDKAEKVAVAENRYNVQDPSELVTHPGDILVDKGRMRLAIHGARVRTAR
jgi:hypothetical protein